MENGSIVNNNIYVDQGTDFEVDFKVSGLSEVSTFVGFAKRVYSEGPSFPVDVVYNGDTMTISIGREVTSDLKEGKYYYNILEEANDDKVKKVLSGLLVVVPTMS